MTVYGVNIPPAPRAGDGWGNTSIGLLRAYHRLKKDQVYLERIDVPTKDGYEVRYEWREETN